MARPRKIPAASPKLQVQLAVSAAGRALATMIETLKTNGSAISQEDFEKAFAFVHSTVAALENQARRDRLSIAASQFSFDDPITLIAPGGYPAGKPSVVRRSSAAESMPSSVEVQPIVLMPDTPAARPSIVRAPVPRAAQLKAEAKPQPATQAGTPIRHFTGRVSKHSSDPDAGKPIVTALESPPLMGEVADVTDKINFLTE